MADPADEETVELFRPVGPRELDRIRELGWRAFPPRLPSQPIFYPVMNEGYADRSPATGTPRSRRRATRAS